MKNVEIQLSSKKYQFGIPSNWHESSYILETCYLLNNSSSPTESIALLYIPSTVKKYLSAIHLREIAKLIEWVVNTSLTYPVLPFFRIRFTKYYLPSQNFVNVRMDEFMDGQGFAIAYEQTGNSDFLYWCIACYCRPKSKEFRNKHPKFADDKRERYSAKLAEERKDLFAKKLDFLTLNYLFTFITGCSKAISENPSYRILFPSKKIEQGEKGVRATNVESANSEMWYDFAIDAGMLPNLGGYEKVREMYVHDVLRAVANYSRDNVGR